MAALMHGRVAAVPPLQEDTDPLLQRFNIVLRGYMMFNKHYDDLLLQRLSKMSKWAMSGREPQVGDVVLLVGNQLLAGLIARIKEVVKDGPSGKIYNAVLEYVPVSYTHLRAHET